MSCMIELGVLDVFYADAIKLRQQALVLVRVHVPERCDGSHRRAMTYEQTCRSRPEEGSKKRSDNLRKEFQNSSPMLPC